MVYLILDEQLKGAIALADIIRPNAKIAIEKFKKLGIKCFMLTGDNKKAAEISSRNIGIEDYFAEILPQHKADTIKKIQSNGHVVAMVGDGINDAPALATSDVGIAIGAGTDIAIETADIVLVKNNLLDVVNLLKLSKATTNKIIQNLLWATGYNIFALPIAAGVLYPFGIILTPAVGAMLMSLSTVIASVNAKLLKLD